MLSYGAVNYNVKRVLAFVSVDKVQLCVNMSIPLKRNLLSVAVSLLIPGLMRYTYVASSSKRVLDGSNVNTRLECLALFQQDLC